MQEIITTKLQIILLLKISVNKNTHSDNKRTASSYMVCILLKNLLISILLKIKANLFYRKFDYEIQKNINHNFFNVGYFM